MVGCWLGCGSSFGFAGLREVQVGRMGPLVADLVLRDDVGAVVEERGWEARALP